MNALVGAHIAGGSPALLSGAAAVTARINLKPAKALGLTIPQSLLLRADEVIQ